MGDVFFRELKEASRAVAATKGRARTNGDKALLDTARQITEISFIVRREGLPVMEAYTPKIRDKSIAAMMMYAIDGTSSEILEDICWSKYYASELKGYDALIYMLWLKAILSMQEGEKPVVVCERIKAMIPVEVAGEIDELFETEMNRFVYLEKNGGTAKLVKKLCEESMSPEKGSESYLLMKIASHILTECVDKTALEIMTDGAEDETLAVAMKGFDGPTRKVIFDALPKDRAKQIAGSMEYLGPVLKKHMFEATYTLFDILRKARDEGEIKIEGGLIDIVK
ncbi:MAG: hypothetical protein IJU43_00700 [Lachnospiraceae bacterium]|nr:hypothetical protein [Lachnospiraceae bacterium]